MLIAHLSKRSETSYARRSVSESISETARKSRDPWWRRIQSCPVRRTRESLKAYGVDDRCSVVEGNFFKSAPGGADTYLFRHIIHDWTDEQSVQILNNCRKVIPNNGRLLIIEAVVPSGNEPSLAKDFDMVMLTFPGGVERTEEEYRFLLERAGFQLNSITPTAAVVSVVEGKPI